MKTVIQAIEKLDEFNKAQPGSARFASLDLHFDGTTATVYHMMTSRYYGTVDISSRTITTAHGKALEPMKTLLYFFYDGAVEYTHSEDQSNSNYNVVI